MCEYVIVDMDYISGSNFPIVRLFTIDKQKNYKIFKVRGITPYFYFTSENCEEIIEYINNKFGRYIIGSEMVEKFEPLYYQEKKTKMVKLLFKSPKNVPMIRDDIVKLGCKVYEADIPYVQRFIDDTSIRPLTSIRFKTNEKKDLYLIDDIDVIEGLELDFKTMAFDIEVLSTSGVMPEPSNDEDKIVLISTSFKPYFKNKYENILLVLKGSEQPDPEIYRRDNLIVCNDEVSLLRTFVALIKSYSPNIITGYNINNFDFSYILKRIDYMKKKRLPRWESLTFDISVDGSVAYQRSTTGIKGTKHGHNYITIVKGRIIYDIYYDLNKRGLWDNTFALKQYSLDYVSNYFLGEGKIDLKYEEIDTWFREKYNNKQVAEKVLSYSTRDSDICIKLIEKLNLLDVPFALSNVSYVNATDLFNRSGYGFLVENILLREFNSNDRVFPSRATDKEIEKREDLKGGFIYAKPGLYKNIVVLDYVSLYPSIMIKNNICFSTLVKDETLVEENNGSDDYIRAPYGGGVFVNKNKYEGIIPRVLSKILTTRVSLKKKLKDLEPESSEYRKVNSTQLALKILMNSFYGYSSSRFAKISDVRIGNAVTSFGRENIIATIEMINNIREDNSFKSVISATDSCFVKIPDDVDPETAVKIILDSVNTKYDLDFDKFISSLLVVAKARYAYCQNGKIRAKGLELIRKDTSQISNRVMSKVLEHILIDGDVDLAYNYVLDVIENLYNSKDLDLKDLIVTKRLKASPDKYKNIEPHVVVVKKMQERGYKFSVGEKVPYIITKGSESIVRRAEHPDYVKIDDVDRDYYIESHIITPVNRIFKVVGKSVSVKKGSVNINQSSLIDF